MAIQLTFPEYADDVEMPISLYLIGENSTLNYADIENVLCVIDAYFKPKVRGNVCKVI